MSLKDPCPSCGGLRDCIDRTPNSVIWACVVCRTHSEERFTPTHLLPKGPRP